jgi:plastocyanin
MQSSLVRLAVVASAFAVSAARADEWGSIRGKFVFKGDAPAAAQLPANGACGVRQVAAEDLVVDANTKGLANVVVFVRTKDIKVNPAAAAAKANPVVLTNRGCQFVPHVVFVQTGQDLVIANADAEGHNSNIASLKNPPSNSLIPAGGKAPVKFAVEEPIPAGVSCNIHPFMKAWVVIRGNPYAAVSNPDGSFELKDLPVGEVELQLWHEKAGNLAEVGTAQGKADKKGRLKVKVEKAGTDLGEIAVETSAFK